MRLTALTAALCSALLAPLAHAVTLAPNEVNIKTPPGVVVKPTWRTGNTSKQVPITLNKQDKLTVNGTVVANPAVVPPPPLACPAATLTWGSTTATCDAAYGGGASGSTASAVDAVGPNVGSATATCTNGVVTIASPVCAPVPPPEMHAGLHVDETSFMTRTVGFDREWTYLTNEVLTSDTIGDFRTVCDPSHMSFDDPIVYPGQPGKAHPHVFFGNTGTNANSTPESILNSGNSTCRGGTINRSAYWAPQMIDTATGKALRPVGLIVYYKTGYRNVTPSKIVPFPKGLRMIAGNPMASAPPVASDPHMGFSCGGNAPKDLSIVNCPAGTELWANITFPQCWDGINLDSPDHKSHMAYAPVYPVPPTGNGCPTTHPVPLTEIAFQVRYLVGPEGTSKWRLASDVYSESIPAGYSMHGDWMNGWRQDILEAWTKNCNNASLNCQAHLLGDGRAMGSCPGNTAGPCVPDTPVAVTVDGWTRVGNDNGFTRLDKDRVVRYGPNADGTYARHLRNDAGQGRRQLLQQAAVRLSAGRHRAALLRDRDAEPVRPLKSCAGNSRATRR
jgi:hypothetical protein